jgi:rSAM/selenodomain-associated transferase 1
MPSTRILVFAKAPLPGQVKTRLIPALGAQGAARLHERLLRETLLRMSRVAKMRPDVGLELWCAPDRSHPLFQELCLAHALRLQDQCAGDLGQRLFAGASEALRRAHAVLLIGSDCPDLGVEQIDQAVSALRAPGIDAVLGPALDGGYALLGIRRAEPGLFTNMPWGGDRVAAVTRERMIALGWCWRELPELRDVDRPEDLDWYPHHRPAEP